MTTKEAFKALCEARGALTKACKDCGISHPGCRAAEIRWRIKQKKMWPLESTMFMYLTKAGWVSKDGVWRKADDQ
jgi:hypothetical protein